MEVTKEKTEIKQMWEINGGNICRVGSDTGNEGKENSHTFLKIYQYLKHRTDIWHRYSSIYDHMKYTYVWICEQRNELNESFMLRMVTILYLDFFFS
jgi:hypothetical protein